MRRNLWPWILRVRQCSGAQTLVASMLLLLHIYSVGSGAIQTEELKIQQMLCLVQYDDRAKLPDHNRLLCEESPNCTYHVPPNDPSMPPYWLKVKSCVDLLKDDRCDVIMWVDSDAYLQTSDMAAFFRLFNPSDSSRGRRASFALSRDQPPWVEADAVNTGVFLFKNDLEGRVIVRSWLNRYEPSKWETVDGEWRCRYWCGMLCDFPSLPKWKTCTWAGVQYEQGAMRDIHKSGLFNIRLLPWPILNYPFCDDISNETLVKHYASYHHCTTFSERRFEIA